MFFVKIPHSILDKKYFLIFLISLIIFVSKWYPLVLNQTNLTTEFFFNYSGDGKYWIPYIKFISELSLNQSFDQNINNLKVLPIPIGSLFIYSFFFKFFNLYGLVFIELFIIFFFILIFFKIFSCITNDLNSLILSILIFSFPEFINFFDIQNTYLNNLSGNFFSFRPHRPIFSNIFFYFGIYLLLKFLIDNEFNQKRLYVFAFFLGLIFSSYYYFLLILTLAFLFVIIYKKYNFYFFKNQYLVFLKSILFFFLAALPFIIILLTHEKDVSTDAGLIELNFERKKILLIYYLNIFFSYKFIILLFVLSISTYLFKENKLILLNFFLFISSVLSPIIFVLLSPNSGLIYHFNNNIIITIFLFSFCLIFLELLTKLNIQKKYLYLILVSIIIFNTSVKFKDNYDDLKLIKSDVKINEFLKVTNKIKNEFGKKLENSSILTFDSDLMIWGILNNIKYFNLLNHMWVPKRHNQIELDLISSLKFLNLKESDFDIFLQNSFTGWRYFNFNVGEIFGYRYQANSLTKKSDFKFKDINMDRFISNSSPRLNQQIAINNSELKRLKNEFRNIKNDNFKIPEIIVLNKDKDFLKNYIVDNEKYCKKFDGKYFILYYIKNNQVCEKI